MSAWLFGGLIFFIIVLFVVAFCIMACGIDTKSRRHQSKRRIRAVRGAQGPRGVQGPNGANGGVVSIANEGSGAAIFDTTTPGGVALLRTLIAGPSVTAHQIGTEIQLSSEEKFPEIAPPDNLIVYVASVADGGNDTTGAGTMGMPYETIARALADVRVKGWMDSATIQIQSINYQYPTGLTGIDVGARGEQNTPLVIRGLAPITTATGSLLAASQDVSSGLWTLTLDVVIVPGQLLQFTSGSWSALATPFGVPQAVTIYVGQSINPTTVIVPLSTSTGPTIGSTFNVLTNQTTVPLSEFTSLTSDGVLFVLEDITFTIGGFAQFQLVNSQVGMFGISFVVDPSAILSLQSIESTVFAGISSHPQDALQQKTFPTIATFKGLFIGGGTLSNYFSGSGHEDNSQFVLSNTGFSGVQGTQSATGLFYDVIVDGTLQTRGVDLRSISTVSSISNLHSAYGFIGASQGATMTLSSIHLTGGGSVNADSGSTLTMVANEGRPSRIENQTAPFTGGSAIQGRANALITIETEIQIDTFATAINVSDNCLLVLYTPGPAFTPTNISNTILAILGASSFFSGAVLNLSNSASGNGLDVEQGSRATIGSPITCNGNGGQGIRVSEASFVLFRDAVTARFNNQVNIAAQGSRITFQTTSGQGGVNLSGDGVQIVPNGAALQEDQSDINFTNDGTLSLDGNINCIGLQLNQGRFVTSGSNQIIADGCKQALSIGNGTHNISGMLSALGCTQTSQISSAVVAFDRSVSFTGSGALRCTDSSIAFSPNGDTLTFNTVTVNAIALEMIRCRVTCAAIMQISAPSGNALVLTDSQWSGAASINVTDNNVTGLTFTRSQMYNNGPVDASRNTIDGVFVNGVGCVFAVAALTADNNGGGGLRTDQTTQALVAIANMCQCINNPLGVSLFQTSAYIGQDLNVRDSAVASNLVLVNTSLIVIGNIDLLRPPANSQNLSMVHSTLDAGNISFDNGANGNVIGLLLAEHSVAVSRGNVLQTGVTGQSSISLQTNSTLLANTGIITVKSTGVTVLIDDNSTLQANDLIATGVSHALQVSNASQAIVRAGTTTTTAGSAILIDAGSSANLKNINGSGSTFGLEVNHNSTVTYQVGTMTVGPVATAVKIGVNAAKTWATIDAQASADSNDYAAAVTQLCSVMVE